MNSKKPFVHFAPELQVEKKYVPELSLYANARDVVIPAANVVNKKGNKSSKR